MKVPSFSTVSRTDPNRYGYVANLCVAKSARRQGIASSMLHFAIESAKSRGRWESTSTLAQYLTTDKNYRSSLYFDLPVALQELNKCMCM